VNRHIGVKDSKNVVITNPLQKGHMILHMHNGQYAAITLLMLLMLVVKL